MKTERILVLIEEGKRIEQQNGVLRNAIIRLANLNRSSITELELQNVIRVVSEYVERALALMVLIEDAAVDSGVEQKIRPMLMIAEDYFLSPEDVIPDHSGLMGLVGDAYLTHSLMQAVSDRHKSQSGVSLLPFEGHEINAFIRYLIGEPCSSILDSHVAATLGSPAVQQNMDQMMAALDQMNLAAGPDPVWGYTSAAEIADVRLGAMGVI